MTPNVNWIVSDDRHGLATIDFVAERDGGRNVTGAVWLPRSPGADAPLVLFGHGASGDRYQVPIPELARRFVDELGCPVLSLDGPVHGLRQAEPSASEAMLVERMRPDAVIDMVDDWHVGIDIAFGRSEIGPRRLAYFGLSMGSTFGMPMLAQREDVIVSTLGLMGTTGGLSHRRATLLDAASKITHPVLYVMQLDDEFLPRDGYLELFDAIASEDKRLHANPGLHGEVPPEELLFAFEFMKHHIESRAAEPVADGSA